VLLGVGVSPRTLSSWAASRGAAFLSLRLRTKVTDEDLFLRQLKTLLIQRFVLTRELSAKSLKPIPALPAIDHNKLNGIRNILQQFGPLILRRSRE